MTGKGTTIDVGRWLRGLGLGQLRGEPATKAPPPEALSVLPKPPQGTAERRQVTVMFCDFVGSTALSARMDLGTSARSFPAIRIASPKLCSASAASSQSTWATACWCISAIRRPTRTTAERAVRAGLELVSSVNALKSSSPLQTRVGIATGLVVIGDVIGSGEAQERGIVGEPIWQRACKEPPNQIPSSSPRARENFWVISSSCRTLGPRKSRASPSQCEHGLHCERLQSKAASRRCMRLV